MGIWDRAEAVGRGFANTITGGANDEIVARLIQAMPVDDDTGIERNYAGGQYEQYRDQQRHDDAESQRKYPGSYGSGQGLAILPSAALTMSAGGLPAVALGTGQGALAGWGNSTRSGTDLLKDTAAGGALGGAFAAGGEALKHATKIAAPAIAKLWKGGPPSAPGAAAATASAGARPAVRPQPKAELNMSTAEDDFGDLMTESERAEFGKKLAANDPLASDNVYDAEFARKLRENPNNKDFRLLKNGPKATPEQEAAAAQKLAEAKASMKFAGEGDARTVYIDPATGRAIKIARVDEDRAGRGIMQNTNEYDAWQAVPEELRANSALNEVLEAAPDRSYIVQRAVKPFNDADMAQYMELNDPTNTYARLRQMAEPNFHGPHETPRAEIMQDRIRQALQEAPGLDYRDVGKASQWALPYEKEARPVLIDYGYNVIKPK